MLYASTALRHTRAILSGRMRPKSPVTRDAHPIARMPARCWTIIALAFFTVVLAACQRSVSGDPEKQAKLANVLAREQALKTQLQALSTGEPAHCPPGYVAETDRASDGTADANGKLAPLARKEMLAKLERATVLVLAPAAKGLASGSGFFISPQHVITNRHVVESSADRRVLLGSRMLQRMHPGTVIAVTTNSDPGSPDFALIRLEEGQAPGILDINTGPTKLSDVTASGYPGIVMRGDPNWVKLVRDHDLSAAPDLNATRGTIQSLQDSPTGTPIIVHTAPIYQGNSGGPLVDACGRVVGVNTFIAVDQQQAGRVSYAIHSQTLTTFTERVGTPIKLDSRACE